MRPINGIVSWGFWLDAKIELGFSLPNLNKVNREERTLMRSQILRKLREGIGFEVVLNQG